MKIRDSLTGVARVGERRSNKERGLFVRQLYRERELLRRVNGIERESLLRLAQRPVEVAEPRQSEAHVVVRLGELRTRLDRARERIARRLEALEIDENQSDAVPRNGVIAIGSENLPVCFEGEIEMLLPEQGEREIQPPLDRTRGRLHRPAE